MDFPELRSLDSRGDIDRDIPWRSVTDFASRTFKPASITLPWTVGSDRESLEDCLYERAGSWIAIIVHRRAAIGLSGCLRFNPAGILQR